MTAIFLNKVCTHMVDIDYARPALWSATMTSGTNRASSCCVLMNDRNKKKEDRIAELEAFITRFGSNASKARQATSRKKTLDKIVLDEILPSSRRYPFIGFTPDREAGKDILAVENLSKDNQWRARAGQCLFRA